MREYELSELCVMRESTVAKIPSNSHLRYIEYAMHDMLVDQFNPLSTFRQYCNNFKRLLRTYKTGFHLRVTRPDCEFDGDVAPESKSIEKL